jgi:F0F1-type ATP synthase membrane subunit b/b'
MQELVKIVALIVAVHAVVLTGVLIVIRRLLLSDTMRAVEKINQVEAEVRKKEEAIRLEIEEHEKEFLKKKADAEEALQRQKTQSEKELTVLRERITAESKKEGERIIEQAKRNEEKFRQQIVAEMEDKAVNYGAQVFSLVFSENISEQLNRHFVSELLDALDGIDSSSITVEGDEAEFTCSYPLAEDQKQRLEKTLADKFGVNIQVNEKVNKDLLAGIVFKLGSLEIDGSLLNRYREAAAEVKKSVGV